MNNLALLSDIFREKQSQYPNIIRIKTDTIEDSSVYERPFFLSSVQAGFPSPAEEYIQEGLDLNKFLISRPSATFFVRMQGDSLREIGIYSEDILVIDRSLNPKDGSIVIAEVNDHLLIRILSNNKTVLKAANNKYSDIFLVEEAIESIIWGVTTSVIRKV